MPSLYVETRLRKQLEDVKSKESELRQHQLRLSLQLEEVEDEKKRIMKKLRR